MPKTVPRFYRVFPDRSGANLDHPWRLSAPALELQIERAQTPT